VGTALLGESESNLALRGVSNGFAPKQQSTMKRALRSGSGMAIVSRRLFETVYLRSIDCVRNAETSDGRGEKQENFEEKTFERLLVVRAAGHRRGTDGVLPVSSTAHLRISEALFHIDLANGYWKMYSIVIQLGAILCLPFYFRERIAKLFSTFPKGRARRPDDFGRIHMGLCASRLW